MMQLLAGHGHTVAGRSEDRRTPLHCAAAHGQAEAVRWLLANRAPVKVKDLHGETPLKLAAAGGYQECMSILAVCDDELDKAGSTGEPPSAFHMVRTPAHLHERSDGPRRRSSTVHSDSSDTDSADESTRFYASPAPLPVMSPRESREQKRQESRRKLHEDFQRERGSVPMLEYIQRKALEDFFAD